MGMSLCRCRNAQTVSRNAQGTISNGNETLLMQIRTMSRNVQGNVSNETGFMNLQVHTSYDIFIEKPSLNPLETPQA